MNLHPLSIRSIFRRSWKLYLEHFWILVLIAALELLVTPQGDDTWVVAKAVSVLALLLLSFMAAKVSLMIVDGTPIDWNRKDFFPTPREYLKFILLVVALCGVLLGGFVLLIIPGLYLMVRLYLSIYAYASQGAGSVSAAMRKSWEISGKGSFWTVVVLIFIGILLNILGALFFGVGLLITGPLTWLASAILFRELEAHYLQQKGSLVVQPAELPKGEGSEEGKI